MWLGIAGLLYGVATYAVWRPVGGAASCALFGLGLFVAVSAVRSPAARSIVSVVAGVVGGIALLLVTLLVRPYADVDTVLVAIGVGMWATMGGLFGACGGFVAHVVTRILGTRAAPRAVDQ